MNEEKYTYRLTCCFYCWEEKVYEGLSLEELTNKIREIDEDEKVLGYNIIKEWTIRR